MKIHAALLLLILSAAPLAAQPGPKAGPELETVKTFDDFRTLGIGVSHDGRVFASAPSASTGISLVEVDPKTGAVTPYPNQDWNTPNPDPSQPQWDSVQAMTVDADNHLWVLDTGRARPDRPGLEPRIVEFNLGNNSVIRNYTFGSVLAPPDSINDLTVDLVHGYSYIANEGNQGSIVVLNLKTGASRQVLVGDRSTKADPSQHLLLNGQVAIRQNGLPAEGQADGIAISGDINWLYYRPLTDHHYYRVPTAALRDESLSPAQLSARVEYMGDAEMTGGIIMGPHNVIYGGDLEHSSVVAVTYDAAGHTLKSKLFVNQPGKLAWADGFAISQGYLYISDSHLNEMSYKNALPKSGPWSIFRVKLP